ncbi:Fasciclin-like arabinogalactan family protein [Thalictrum thalictroides]|uniref:Fasciclin-like arabinogalactan family protein n=1 Tax=Thalictrum thalictroides TaxID=46969 RepID=A0A7J6X4R2_THATH|nr:Fasciclin-like arabinogalactan family protein [Thalictrum thalictroides]
MVSSSPPSTPHVKSPPKLADLPLAISDMGSKSYYGFIILLDVLNATTKSGLSQQVTFFMPSDQLLAESRISPDRLEEFVLGHTIPEPLVYGELQNVPSGTLVPSLMKNQLLRISSIRRRVFVNNAQIVAPNVCKSATIKCHGINAVIGRNNEIASAVPDTDDQGSDSDP